MATESYFQPALPASKRMDVSRFQTVLVVVSNIGGGERITLNASAAVGGVLAPYASVKEGDLTIAGTITANGAYACDAFAEFSWTSSAGSSSARVDVIAKG